MIALYCIAKTFPGRLGIEENTHKTRMSFEEYEVQNFPKRTFAKLIHKALYGDEITNEDIDDPNEWPTLVIVKEHAEFPMGIFGFRGHCLSEEWCAGYGTTKEMAQQELASVG